MIVQSHRGAGKLAPENTLEAFDLGWKLGTVPEADVRATRDDVPVAFHDDTFARLVKDAPAELRALGVGDLSWEELSRLDVGAYLGEQFAGQRIPKIEAVFAAMRGRPERGLYLDIKIASLESLAALARESGVSEQVILASTDYSLIRQWKQLAPESKTLLWMGSPEPRLRERMEELKAADFEGITQLQIHVRMGDLSAADPFKPSSEFLREVARELEPRGILFQALPMGLDTVEVYHRLMDLGVQSFATDDPEVTLDAVETYRGRNAR